MGRSLSPGSVATSWMSDLPLVLLGLRSTIRPDADCCPADVVFGRQLRLPGDLLDSPASASVPSDPASFVSSLASSMASLRPIAPVRRGPVDPGQVPAALRTVPHVFLRVDAVKRPLTPPYDGPFRVLDRAAKTFVILKNNRHVKVSIDRLKPEFLLKDLPVPVPSTSTRPTVSPEPDPVSVVPPGPADSFSRSGRLLRPPTRLGF